MQKAKTIFVAAAVCLATLSGLTLDAQQRGKQHQTTCPTCNGTGKVAATQPPPPPPPDRGGSRGGGGIAAAIQGGQKQDLKFGAYSWRVVEVRRDRALIITEKNVENRQFHSNAKSFTKWEDSDIRKYLNGTFLQSFSRNDQSQMVTGPDTIFLLTLAESNKLGGNNERKNGAEWWLRTPGNTSDKIATIGSNGAVQSVGTGVTYSRGVRPALWIKL